MHAQSASPNLDQMRRLLRPVVARLAPIPAERDDLMQEACIQLWRLQQEHPGQTQAWYLQGCRYHLQNHLRRGRSVDSMKRAGARVLLAEEEAFLWPDSNGAIWEEISAHDTFSVLSEKLTSNERDALACFAAGFSAREIASLHNVSHTLVNKRRHKIAATAVRLGITLGGGVSAPRHES